MRVVIGSGRNRHSFEVPLNKDERQSMIDEVIQLMFRRKNA